MRALCDVNVLLALMDEDHMHHRRALSWWAAHATHGWASCPLTQNGFVRIMSLPGYPRPQSPAKALLQLQTQIDASDHQFWPDDISIADPALFDRDRILGPNQITDIYLLALAVKHGGRLVTFDGAISIGAIHGAGKENCVIV